MKGKDSQDLIKRHKRKLLYLEYVLSHHVGEWASAKEKLILMRETDRSKLGSKDRQNIEYYELKLE